MAIVEIQINVALVPALRQRVAVPDPTFEPTVSVALPVQAKARGADSAVD